MSENKGFFARWKDRLGLKKAATEQQSQQTEETAADFDINLGWERGKQIYETQVARVAESLHLAEQQLKIDQAQAVRNVIDEAQAALADYQGVPQSVDDLKTWLKNLQSESRRFQLQSLDEALQKIANGRGNPESVQLIISNESGEAFNMREGWRRVLEIYEININRVEESLRLATPFISDAQAQQVRQHIQQARSIVADYNRIPTSIQNYWERQSSFKDAGGRVPLYQLDTALLKIAHDKTANPKLDEVLHN